MTRHIFAIKSILLAALALASINLARAQELTMPGSARPDEFGPHLGAPEPVPAGPPNPEEVDAAHGPMMAPDALDFDGHEHHSVLDKSVSDMWKVQPALTESTGTWLRRGWWYTEVDGVVLNRMWKRDDTILAADNTIDIPTRRLLLSRADPGASGAARLTLGRFLFRDVVNRDHTMEFTAFGGGEWGQHDTLSSADDSQSLTVPFGIDDFNPSFDMAETMSVDYQSRFTSFELNYRVKERLRRDRMVLTPGGEWVRTTNEGITRQYLVGLRYMDMVDILDWRATNIGTFGGEDGRYLIDTNNDMFGLQFGCNLLMEHDRWNLEIGGKGGPFINDVKADSRLTITNDQDNSFTVNNRESTISFIGEAHLMGRYHLRPHLSLRAGWQMMYITSVALAPDQINFSPDEGRFPYTGDPFYNGAVFGFEGYW